MFSFVEMETEITRIYGSDDVWSKRGLSAGKSIIG